MQYNVSKVILWGYDWCQAYLNPNQTQLLANYLWEAMFNYTEHQYNGAAAQTVTTRLQHRYAEVRCRWKMVIMREGERQALPCIIIGH